MIFKFRKFALLSFISLVGGSIVSPSIAPDWLVLINLGSLAIFLFCAYLIVKSIKNNTILSPDYEKISLFLELKSAISFYVFLKNQIVDAYKIDTMVSHKLIVIFKDFLDKKLQTLESFLQKANPQEKQAISIWISSKGIRKKDGSIECIFPEELIDLLAKYDIQWQPKTQKPSALVEQSHLVINDLIPQDPEHTIKKKDIKKKDIKMVSQKKYV